MSKPPERADPKPTVAPGPRGAASAAAREARLAEALRANLRRRKGRPDAIKS